jgi:hypothetical protein
LLNAATIAVGYTFFPACMVCLPGVSKAEPKSQYTQRTENKETWEWGSQTNETFVLGFPVLVSKGMGKESRDRSTGSTGHKCVQYAKRS